MIYTYETLDGSIAIEVDEKWYEWLTEADKLERKGFTQEELAEISNISSTHEKHIESGHRLPSVEVLFAIAQALDMSVDNVVFPKHEKMSGRTNEMQILLNQCNERELQILLDLARSLVSNRK